MNIAIFEDEKPAADKLVRLIQEYNSTYQIIGKFTNVIDSTNFLKKNAELIDLLFVDIQLTDGNSFEIFEQVNVKIPIIFTTAFNNYAIQAFKLNSIDYILKPYDFADIKNALQKFESIKETYSSTNNTLDINLLKNLILSEKNYKTRFMVRKGEKIKAITTSDIKLFYADDRDVFLLSENNRRYNVNQKLEDLNKLLDPTKFFKVNRSFIVQFSAINEVIAYSNSRLKLDVGFKTDKDIVVSRDKVNDFKKWMEGE